MPEDDIGMLGGPDAARRLESRSYGANKRLDAIEQRVRELEELLDNLARHDILSKQGARLYDVERGHARALAEAEQQRDEALKLLRDYEDHPTVGSWKRSRDLFLERLKRAKTPT